MGSKELEPHVALTHWSGDLSKEFIDTGKLSEPLNSIYNNGNIQYVPETGRYIARNFSPESQTMPNPSDAFRKKTADQRQKLRQRLLDLQAKCIRHKKGMRIDLDATHNWEGVEAMLREAAALYENKKGVVPPVEHFFKRIGNCGTAVQAWMSLLPDGDYSSFICGGFKLIISVSSLGIHHD